MKLLLACLAVTFPLWASSAAAQPVDPLLRENLSPRERMEYDLKLRRSETPSERAGIRDDTQRLARDRERLNRLPPPQTGAERVPPPSEEILRAPPVRTKPRAAP